MSSGTLAGRLLISAATVVALSASRGPMAGERPSQQEVWWRPDRGAAPLTPPRWSRTLRETGLSTLTIAHGGQPAPPLGVFERRSAPEPGLALGEGPPRAARTCQASDEERTFDERAQRANGPSGRERKPMSDYDPRSRRASRPSRSAPCPARARCRLPMRRTTRGRSTRRPWRRSRTWRSRIRSGAWRRLARRSSPTASNAGRASRPTRWRTRWPAPAWPTTWPEAASSSPSSPTATTASCPS